MGIRARPRTGVMTVGDARERLLGVDATAPTAEEDHGEDQDDSERIGQAVRLAGRAGSPPQSGASKCGGNGPELARD